MKIINKFMLSVAALVPVTVVLAQTIGGPLTQKAFPVCCITCSNAN